jgi:hypothetical protein
MREFPLTGVRPLEIVDREEWIRMIRILRAATAILGAAAFLAVSAATALAGDGYGGGAGGVKGESAGGSGGLPFTGYDMALYALVAAGLLASGLALRAYSARRVD